ncbi:MAG: hypothetical protein WAP35_03220 [Solirubrobacterales bacterium]
MREFLFITATDGSDRSRAHLADLFESIDRQAVEGAMIVVCRGAQPPLPAAVGAVAVKVVECPLQTGLSKVRNLALAHAEQTGLIDRAALIAFPDDDCSYPAGVLASVDQRMGGTTTVVAGAYAPDGATFDRARFPTGSRPLGARLVMQVVSSNNVFFAASAVREIGRFDERFGLGAEFGAAEDCDFTLRILELGDDGIYDSAIVVQHPYKPGRPAEYFTGNVALLGKHAGSSARVKLLLARRIVLGLALMAKREITPRQFKDALRGAREMRRAFKSDH